MSITIFQGKRNHKYTVMQCENVTFPKLELRYSRIQFVNNPKNKLLHGKHSINILKAKSLSHQALIKTEK